MNFFVSVNLASGSNEFAVGALTDNKNTFLSYTSISYGANWVFDSTLDISLCSDYNKVKSIACRLQNVKVIYSKVGTYLSIPDLANTVTIRADYKLNQGSGKSPANSHGSFGSAKLCNFLFFF